MNPSFTAPLAATMLKAVLVPVARPPAVVDSTQPEACVAKLRVLNVAMPLDVTPVVDKVALQPVTKSPMLVVAVVTVLRLAS